MNPTLRVIPLGGLGEIGKNMMALECDGDIIVIDCGVQFPTEDMPGVDLIIPDITYLAGNIDRVRAILINPRARGPTSGALPYVLPPTQRSGLRSATGPRLDLSQAQGERASSRGAIAGSRRAQRPVQVRGTTFQVTWFRVCHSIPDAMGMVIENSGWDGDSHRGLQDRPQPLSTATTIDLATLAEHGSRGVLLLCSDSTYAELSGFTPVRADHGRGLRPGSSARQKGGSWWRPFASLIFPHPAGGKRRAQA